MFTESGPDISGTNGPFFWAKNTNENDLVVTELEVTQGIQSKLNQMPLVGGRRTAVRGYIQSRLNVGGIKARLRAYRNGLVELPLSPLLPESEIQGQIDKGNRLNVGDSFLFKLPAAWTEPGLLLLRLELDPDDLVPELDEGNNVHEEYVEFSAPIAIDITSVPFHLHPNGDRKNPSLTFTAAHPSFWPIVRNLLRYHPISSFKYWDCGVEVQKPTFHDTREREWNPASAVDQALLLSRVAVTRASTDCGPRDMFWVGLVHPKINTVNEYSFDMAGIAVPFGRSSWIKMSDLTSSTTPWSMSGGATIAHELGHNLGLFHVICRGDEGFPSTPLYPYPAPHCRMAKGGDGYFGFDLYHDLWNLPAPTVISNDPLQPEPHQGFPLMGYKSPEWSDPFGYCRMLEKYGVPCDLVIADVLPPSRTNLFASLAGHGIPPPEAETALPGPSINEPRLIRDYLMISGAFEERSESVAELEVIHLTNPPTNALQSKVDAPPLTEEDPMLDIVQIGEAGVLSIQPVQLDMLDGLEGVHSLFEVVAAQPGAIGIQIWRDGKVLAEKLASAEPPWVSISAPQGGGDLKPGALLYWCRAGSLPGPPCHRVPYSIGRGLARRGPELHL